MQDFSFYLPGSKSISLRSLILAALADGASTLRGLANCDDVEEMKGALTLFGVTTTGSNAALSVVGTGGKLTGSDRTVQLGLSGTSTRFLLGLSALSSGCTKIDGRPSLQARPNSGLVDALRELGCTVRLLGQGGLPVEVQGPPLLKNVVTVDGSLSSQFISALMQIGPSIHGGLLIEIRGTLVSVPYLQITTRQMALFGIDVSWESNERIVIPQGTYVGADIVVEGDASAASYFAALALLHGRTVEFMNLGTNTVQGDYRFFELCEMLGATVERFPDRTKLTGPGAGKLRPVPHPIDMEDMPDVAPTMMIVAPFVQGGLRIEGLSTLRYKECDRLAIPAAHLRSLGIEVEEGPDYIVIPQGKPTPTGRVSLETHHDHRIAMSFGVLGTMVDGIEILEPDCVSKTYPNFWDVLGQFEKDQ